LGRLAAAALAVSLVLASVGLLADPASAQPVNKLVVIVMENEPYGKILGSREAPYLDSLSQGGLLFTSYTAVKSGSGPNYLAMTSGLTAKVSPPSPNVFQAIDATGGALTWQEFDESMGANCGVSSGAKVPGTDTPLYTRGHDPAYQYHQNDSCKQNDVPMSPSTFAPANLPDLSYVVPNQCDDMHSLPGRGQPCPAYFGSNTGTSKINMGDHWLSVVVPQLLQQPGVTVLITWDESGGSTSPPEHIVTLEAGPGALAGSTDATSYNHYGLEAGLYRYFELGTAPNHGSTATVLPIATQQTLSLSASGAGTGSVMSSPSGIDCTSPCSSASASFPYSQSVTLTATPDNPSGSISWTGCDSFTSTTCTVSMTGARSVSVTFS
jgi:hypothetical protein